MESQLHEHVGFYLYDLSSKKIKADYNGAKFFTPASNTKIFTLYTSLRLLEDSIVSLKYIRKGDSLVFQGLGDPSFLYRDVFDNGRTYQFLKEQPGRLFFSSDNFQTQRLGSGWAWDDYNDYYSAERTSLPLYGNVISIDRREDGKFGFIPFLFTSDFQISSEVHGSTEVIRDINSNHLTYFEGKRKLKKKWTVPFYTSDEVTRALLMDTLHRNVEEIHLSQFANTSRLKSIPADSLYKVMMQASDNFIAEQLLLQCASVVSDTLKSEIAIRYAKENFLADLPDTVQWVDGSGLSRYNLFTPRSIVALWKKIYETVPQDRLFKLLAVGGGKGTLKNYFKAQKPYVFGKTGSLSNNATLSGFLITRKGRVFIFSFANNNFIAPGSDVRKRMEKIVNRIREKN